MRSASGRRLRGAHVISRLVVLVTLVGACGGSAASATPQPTSVDVTLQEWAVVPASTTLKAGAVTFNAKNVGPQDPHEFVILKTELGALDLPTGADGKVDEAASGIETVGEIEEIAVGGQKSATFQLAPGKYVFICNIIDADGDAHYVKGMAIEVTVE